MKKRILSSIVAIAAVIILLCFRTTIIMPIAVAIIGSLGVYEIFRATDSIKSIMLLLISILIMIASAFAVTDYLKLPVTVLLYVYFILSALLTVIKYSGSDLSRNLISFVMSSSLICGLSCIVSMFSIEHGMYYFLLAAFCAFITDAGAYFVGSAVGKHHFAPKVSPRKTVEGSIGGLACSVVVNIIFTYIYTLFFTDGAKIDLFILVFAILIASASGMIGDLLASAVKRKFGIKDYGKIMPGHGGVMDRCDSLIFSAPVILFFATSLHIF